MGSFQAKEVFRQAKEAEKKGDKRGASAGYASVGVHLRRAGKFREAKAIFERAIQLSPTSPRIYLQLVRCEIGLENGEGAEKALVLFTRLAIRKKKVEKYTPYLELELREAPELRQKFYEALLDLDRTTAAPFLALAKTLVEQQNYEGARRTLLDALKTKTMDAEVMGALQYVLEAQEEKQALAHLQNYKKGKLERGDFILLLSDRAKAPPPMMEGRPENSQEKNLKTLIRDLESEMGINLQEGHDGVDALVQEFRQRSNKILSGDSKARIDMSLAFYEMGLYADARSELEPVGPTDPLHLEAQCLLGEILIAEGSDLGALEIYQKCLRDERAVGDLAKEAKYKLIQIYFRLGDLDQAFQHARDLERKDADYRDVRRLRFQIQEALGPAATTESPPLRKTARAAAGGATARSRNAATAVSRKTRKL